MPHRLNPDSTPPPPPPSPHASALIARAAALARESSGVFSSRTKAMQADVLEYYDQTVSSPRGSFYIHVVLRVPQLLQVVKRRRVKHCLSRKNILFRDGFSWQQAFPCFPVKLTCFPRRKSSCSFWDDWDHGVLWLLGIWSELGTQQELLL